MKKNGFTFVELLVVITMLVLLMTGIVAAMTSTFRAQTRLGLSTKVVQNGNYALDEIKKNILNAKGVSIVCPNLDIGSSISFSNVIDGQTTTLSCDDITQKKIASISAVRPSDIIDLTSKNEVIVKNCNSFVACNRSASGMISNIEFKFTISAGDINAGKSNYFEKSFTSKITIRN